ncbi:transposase [Paraburkholderia sp. RL18-085-BIA-A]|uniref:transposase n=1 Tax=Paraburkholderia sp. RL18-085-BIA-A TaxID=3031633 RepID=UPI0038BA52A2
MKRASYSDAQIAVARKKARLGTAVEEVYRKIGIDKATFYVWRKKCDGQRRRGCITCVAPRKRIASIRMLVADA